MLISQCACGNKPGNPGGRRCQFISFIKESDALVMEDIDGGSITSTQHRDEQVVHGFSRSVDDAVNNTLVEDPNAVTRLPVVEPTDNVQEVMKGKLRLGVSFHLIDSYYELLICSFSMLPDMSITVIDVETSSLDVGTAFGIEYGGLRLRTTGEDVKVEDKIRGMSNTTCCFTI